jgi:hypothetical protein
MSKSPLLLAVGFAALAFAQPAVAAPKRVTVTIQNIAPVNSVAFAPLRVGFGNGSFDAFNNGTTATAPIISIAEGGSGSAWFPAFSAADPTAVLGSVGMGALLSGQSATAMFTVDSMTNNFFTFASMVLPSNDFFIGNDNPQAYRLFDSFGNLAITSIDQSASQIWNAGSEAFDPLNSAFIQGGTNALRTPENGVVSFNFAELARFNGQTTGAGYTFQSNLAANTQVFRISFSAVDAAVPEPGTWATMLLGFGLIGYAQRKRAGSPVQARVKAPRLLA